MKYLRMSAFVMLYLSVYFIIQNYIGSIIALFYGMKEFIENRGMINDPNSLITPLLKGTVVILIISAVLSFFIYWFAFWLRKENMFRFCDFSRLSIRNILFVALLGISLVLPVEYLVSLLSLDKLSPSTGKMFDVIFEANSFPVLLLGIGIVGPIIEEIIFRGLVFKELRRNMPMVAALLIQAFLFGAYHLNLTQAIYAFALGIILGLVCIWTESIWSSIIIHMLFNSTSVVLSKVPGAEPKFLSSSLALIASCILAVVFIILLVMTNKKRESI